MAFRTGIMASAYTYYAGYAEGFKLIKKHGYDCMDFQDFMGDGFKAYALPEDEFEKMMADIKKAAADADVTVWQTHGPWRWPPRDRDEADLAERFEKMSRAIVGTRLLGCRYCVLHPMMPFGTEEDPDPEGFMRINRDFFARLLPVAEQNGVILCLENMPMPALRLARPLEILEFVKSFDSPWFRVCLDTGHAATLGIQPAEAVKQIGKEYLAVMHVHDNEGTRDFHWQPFEGVTDWPAFSAALKEIGFEGVISLETQVSRKLPVALREENQIALAHKAKAIAE